MLDAHNQAGKTQIDLQTSTIFQQSSEISSLKILVAKMSEDLMEADRKSRYY